MNFQDLTTLIEQDERSIFISRNADRKEQHERNIQRYIQEYIKNGSIGDLYLGNTPIKSLPDNLVKVGGNLEIHLTDIKELPKNLKLIDGRFVSSDHFTKYPSHVKIMGSIAMISSKITEIPENVEFHEDLNLSKTWLSKLPDNLYIPKSLYLGFCKNLTELPKGLNVKNLWLPAVPHFTHLPNDIIVRDTAYLDRKAPAFKDRDFRQQFLFKNKSKNMYPGINKVKFVG